MKILQELDGVMFGGGPLDRGVGNTLSAKGVKLCNAYGWCAPLILSNTLNSNLQCSAPSAVASVNSSQVCRPCSWRIDYSHSVLANLDEDWDYYEMAKAVEAEYVPDGNGNYEFIVKVSTLYSLTTSEETLILV